MKVCLAAAAAASLLLEPINAQQLASNQRRLRNRNLSESTAALSKAGKSKASKSMEAHSLTGRYTGVDTEDATEQNLFIVCDDDEDKDEGGICNIILEDPRFSTCDQIVPGTNGGVAIANGVPQDSIDDFNFDLYCLQPGETEINFSNGPTTTLRGDIEVLPDGSLRRTGPGFFYTKVSLPEIKDVSSDEVANIDDESVNPNGSYRGVDLADGSFQSLNVLCKKDKCDIILRDTSYTICKASTGQSIFNGVGIAKDVPRDSLSNFDIKLYCLEKDERLIDYNREPDATLTGNLKLVRDGIIQRTEPGITYIRSTPNEVEEPFSVYQDFALSLDGVDTEDGSEQFLEIVCKRGLCDVELTDSSFSTCIDAIPGDIYLGGLAKATDVPQDSLYDFDLLLYCASDSDLIQGIDYNNATATLKGGFVFLEGGIIKRTGPGFTYYNRFKRAGDDRALTATSGSSLYQGIRYDTGDSRILSMSCQKSVCEVILRSNIEPICIGPSGGLPFLNGLAINRNVPEDSLDGFEIGLYCVPPPPGTGAVIDYNTQQPILTIKASITPSDQRGIIRLGENDNDEIILFKLSAGE